MVEDTKLVSSFDATDGDLEGEEQEVEILTQLPPSENVRAPGSDVHKGDLVMQKGERICGNGGEIGTLAFVGRKEVSVYKKPIVGILSTGNEIVDLHSPVSGRQEDEWGDIFDTNRPSLQAAVESLGYTVVDLGIISDTYVVKRILHTELTIMILAVLMHMSMLYVKGSKVLIS